MDSNLVIKVKYGDMLRRFTVTVNANGILDMGMAGLTAKICSLFKFNFVDDITLTYTDEDKDVITLVDDEDLHDVIGQRLNPLRINVLLKTSSGEMFDATSSGWSNPSSQQQGNQLNRINSGLNEALKSLPDPLGDVLSKLSSDLASKAVSSAPVLSELVERFAKLGMTTSQSQGNGTDLSADNKLNENAKKSSSASEAPLDPTKTTKAKGISSSTSPTSDLSFDYLSEPQNAPSGKSFAAGSSGSSTPMMIPAPNPIPQAPSAPANPNLKRVSSCGEKREKRGSGSGQPSAPNHGSPVSGMIGGNSSEAAPVAGYWGVPPFRRSYSHFDSTGRVFHKGVQCDGCGVHPITGPRFKSKVRDNYDLCSICVSELGSDAEYTRIDKPIFYRCPRPRPFAHGPAPPSPYLPHILQGRGKKQQLPYLQSHFIQDVNIPDGTLVAPLTPFTKIWRLVNNGTIPWPCGSQLVWNDGYQFTTTGLVSAQIPGDGCPVGTELDIAVDFTAPAAPGRYISYWRMMSPSGEMFGERIWVLIEVDTSLLDSLPDLNAPPFSNAKPKTQVIDMNTVPVDVEEPQNVNSDKNAESVKPMVDEVMSEKELDVDRPVDVDGSGSSNSVVVSPEVAPALPSYPVIDSSVVPPPLPPAGTVEGNDINNNVEESLLKELADMGFKEIDLNKEILRLNEYNLEQSLDDLCGVSEWDPILEELQEMGFPDRETNKMLLIKNGGSIKRVVMDLVAGEKTV
ncbi:hypothetical protein C5167_026106 [Papaver somniferum]|uniref:protein NBR1 homolog n=1 Tax=Papaver somniferum TaxID=3469 RepID=UPI000E7001B4|nr:protein NBR1 homolog [Papaver somniferum]RZC93348.1 hypothetical protein C5167_026106 [Papaver somniferum]